MKHIKVILRVALIIIIALSLNRLIFSQEKSPTIIVKELGKPTPNSKYSWIATKLNKEISQQFRKKGLDYRISNLNETDIKKNLEDAKKKNSKILFLVTYKIFISPGTIKNDSFTITIEVYNVENEKLIYKQEGESIVGTGANSLIEEMINNVSSNLVNNKGTSPSSTLQNKIVAKTNNSIFLKSDTLKKGEAKVALMLNFNKATFTPPQGGEKYYIFNYNGQIELSYGIIDYLELGIIAPYMFKRIRGKTTEKNTGFEPSLFSKYKVLKDEKDGLNATVGALYQPQINDKMYNGDTFYIASLNSYTDFQTFGGQLYIDKTYKWLTPYLNIEYLYFLYSNSYKVQTKNTTGESKLDNNFNFRTTLGFEYRLLEEIYIYPQVTFTYYSPLKTYYKNYDGAISESPGFSMTAWITGIGVGYQLDSNTGISLFSTYAFPYKPKTDNADNDKFMPDIEEFRIYGFFSMKFNSFI